MIIIIIIIIILILIIIIGVIIIIIMDNVCIALFFIRNELTVAALSRVARMVFFS